MPCDLVLHFQVLHFPVLHFQRPRLSDWSDEAFTRSDRRTDWSVRPVGQTGRTDCSRTAHICQSNQCGLLAD